MAFRLFLLIQIRTMKKRKKNNSLFSWLKKTCQRECLFSYRHINKNGSYTYKLVRRKLSTLYQQQKFFLQIQPRETFARAAPFFLDGLDINWLEREVGRSVQLKRSRYKKLFLSFKKYKMSQKTRHHIKLAWLKGAAGSLVIWGCFDTS